MNPNFSDNTNVPRRLSQSENRALRRSSLLGAAIECVARYDIDGATVEKICAHAGASRGLIAHYFSSKEELLLAALQNWFDEALTIKKQIAKDASLSPEEKIRQIAAASLSPPTYRWEMAAAWQAFTNASRHNPAFAKPIRESSREIRRLVSPLFASAAKQRKIKINASQAALGLYVLDDGLWNSLASGKDALSLKSARAVCDRYIDGCLQGNENT